MRLVPALCLVATTWLGCGGTEGTLPTDDNTNARGYAADTREIRLNANGVHPRTTIVGVGSTVIFRNKDIAMHHVVRDPVTNGGTCPDLDLPPIEPNATAMLFIGDNFELCGFRDETDPTNPAFQGALRTTGQVTTPY